MPDVSTPAARSPLRILGGVPRPHGQSIKEHRGPDAPFENPKWVTLMAIQITADRKFRFRTLKMPVNGINDVETAEKTLLVASRGDTYVSPVELVSDTIDEINFTTPSWFTLVLDSDDWDFCYNGSYANYDQFIFYDFKTEIVGGQTVPKIMDENWSFFNAAPVSIADTSGAKYNAVRCVNYVKRPNAAGEDLGKGEHSPFGFNIFINVALAKTAMQGARVIIIIDPTGENKGPP